MVFLQHCSYRKQPYGLFIPGKTQAILLPCGLIKVFALSYKIAKFWSDWDVMRPLLIMSIILVAFLRGNIDGSSYTEQTDTGWSVPSLDGNSEEKSSHSSSDDENIFCIHHENITGVQSEYPRTSFHGKMTKMTLEIPTLLLHICSLCFYIFMEWSSGLILIRSSPNRINNVCVGTSLLIYTKLFFLKKKKKVHKI